MAETIQLASALALSWGVQHGVVFSNKGEGLGKVHLGSGGSGSPIDVDVHPEIFGEGSDSSIRPLRVLLDLVAGCGENETEVVLGAVTE
jgi:hypothetical protein